LSSPSRPFCTLVTYTTNVADGIVRFHGARRTL
jgi:hypothetical protein